MATAAAEGYGIKGAKGIESDAEYWTLERCKRAYLDYLANKRLEIEEQKQARCYRHGAQWTPSQVEVFNARKQPVVTFNRIGRKIDSIVGLMEKLKQDPKAYPRNPRMTDEMGADLATATVRYVVESELRESKFPLCAEHGAVDGIAGVEMMLVKGDKGDTDIGFALVRTDSFFYDPRSYDHDFFDARYMGQGKWLDLDDAMALAPSKEIAESIKQGNGFGSELTSMPDREKWYMGEVADMKRVRVVDIWYRSGGAWKWCMFTGSVKIEEGEGYFSDEKGESICKYIMFSSFVDQDGDRYGFVRTLRSSQDEINQRRSKGLHELVSRRIKAEEGAFADIELARRESVRPDGVIIYNKGFEMEFDDQARVTNIEGQLKFLEDAKNEIENFGPSPALIGQGLEYKSGRAINLLQQAGIAELGPFVIGIKNWKLRLYRAIWSAAQRYWTSERWIRVTDVEGIPQMIQLNGLGVDPMSGLPRLVNAVGQLDVNFVLDEGPDEVNMMGDAYDTLVALTAQGANIPPTVLLELAPLQGQLKRKLLAMVNKEDPVAEQAKGLALAGEAAKVDETKSKTALNMARAQSEAQGGDRGAQEMMLDATLKREEHQLKMVEGMQKAQTAREVGRAKVAGEFAKLESQRMQSAQDVHMNALKGAQALRQGEDKHQQQMRQAAAKAAMTKKESSLPGYQFGGEPKVGDPALVGERGPETFVDATGQRVILGRHGPEVFVPDVPGTVVPRTGMGRERFLDELQDPRIRDRVLAYARAEVGGQGPEAIQAILETFFNRATARGLSLRQVLAEPHEHRAGTFFPAITHSRARSPVTASQRAEYEPILSEVLAGSNITNYATGNASGTVGFAGGPQTFASGGERFGIEGSDKDWWIRRGITRGLESGAPGALEAPGVPATRPGQVAYTGAGGLPRQPSGPPSPPVMAYGGDPAGTVASLLGEAPKGLPKLDFGLVTAQDNLADLQSRFQGEGPRALSLPRISVSGSDPRQLSYGVGTSLPFAGGALDLGASFGSGGFEGLKGVWKKGF
jgi:hypothetical protein